MKKKFRWGLLLLVIIVAGITAFLYIQSKPKTAAPPPSSASAGVLQFPVTKEDLSTSMEIKGKTSYVKETFIYAPFTADVMEWHVAEGTEVNQGDTLFSLNSKGLENEIIQQRASLEKSDLEAKLRSIENTIQQSSSLESLSLTEEETLKKLAQEKSKELQLKLEKINTHMAETQLKEQENKLKQATFVAADDGIFLFVNQNEPKTVRENEVVGKIVDMKQLQLTSTVGEYEVFDIQPGMTVDVRVDALRELRLTGTVIHVSKFAKETTSGTSGAAQFEIIISLEENERLIAGLGVTGTIETHKREGALVIPSLTVYKERDSTYVYKQGQDGAIERKEIRIGMETAEKTEVLEGLSEGDIVILQ